MGVWFYWSIGRLTDGSLILLDRLDEMEGRALILTTDRSDNEAVADWITDLNDVFDDIQDYQTDIRRLAIHIVKEGNSIEFLSEFNPKASETLEVGLSINLSAAELDELWPMLETRK